MFNIAPKIIETLLAIYPEPDGDDFDEIATTCIVNLQRNMADLNSFLLATRGKKVTDRRREVSAGYISNMLFYTTILIHLNNLEPDLFDMAEDAEDNAVFDSTAMFDEQYFYSPLLLGTHMMGICADIGEYMWSEQFGDDYDEPIGEILEPVEATGTQEIEIPEADAYRGFMSTLLEGMESDSEEDDTFFSGDNDAEPMINRLLAGLMIMADLCEVDLGDCMYRASQITEI